MSFHCQVFFETRAHFETHSRLDFDARFQTRARFESRFHCQVCLNSCLFENWFPFSSEVFFETRACFETRTRFDYGAPLHEKKGVFVVRQCDKHHCRTTNEIVADIPMRPSIPMRHSHHSHGNGRDCHWKNWEKQCV